jgi:aminoglycoside N3'-acetyltransferase
MNLKLKVWNLVKKKFRIRSKELLINKYRRKIERIIYKNKYDTLELIGLMKGLGLKKGSNVFIHSSWDEFYNYTGTIDDFINAILNEIGENGTLAMPAYPLLRRPDSIFDICKTPTEAGLIAETFRKYPGVKRSINRHSVCALGPLSDFLLNEHQFSITSWDEKSPYFKLSKVNALIFTFGLGKYFVGTTMHCADSLLREESPYFSQFFQKKTCYRFRLTDQSIIEQVCLTSAADFQYYFTNRSHNRVVKLFDKTKYKRTRISNLTVNMYDANYIINKTIELGKMGITVYIKPKMKKTY